MNIKFAWILTRRVVEVGQCHASPKRVVADDLCYRQAIGLSPEQYVQLKKIEMEREVCLRDKCTFIDSGGTVPTVQVK